MRCSPVAWLLASDRQHPGSRPRRGPAPSTFSARYRSDLEWLAPTEQGRALPCPARFHGREPPSHRRPPRAIQQLLLAQARQRRVEEIYEECSRPVLIGVEQRRAPRRFGAADMDQRGRRASLLVSCVENSNVPARNRARLQKLFERASWIDPYPHPETRLANLLPQRETRWLPGRIDESFLDRSAAAGKGHGNVAVNDERVVAGTFASGCGGMRRVSRSP